MVRPLADGDDDDDAVVGADLAPTANPSPHCAATIQSAHGPKQQQNKFNE